MIRSKVRAAARRVALPAVRRLTRNDGSGSKSMGPAKSLLLLESARDAERSGEWLEAERLYRRAVQEREGDPHSKYRLARFLQKQARWREAEEAFREAINSGFTKPNSNYNLGRVLQEQERWSEAESEFRQAIGSGRGAASWHYNLAKVLQEQEKYHEAVESLQTAIKTDPTRAQWVRRLASILSNTDDIASAAEAWESALALRPGEASWHYNLGLARRRMHDWGGAEIAIRKALALDPEKASWHYSLATLLRRRGDFEGAISEFREAIRLDGSNLRWHNSLANALRKQRDFSGAFEAVEGARPLDSDALVEAISSGQDLLEATVNFVHRNATASHRPRVRGFCESLVDSGSGNQAGALGLGIIANETGCPEMAQEYFSQLPESIVLRYASSEFWHSLFQVDVEAAASAARAAVQEFPGRTPPSGWLVVAQMLTAFGFRDDADSLLQQIDAELERDETWQLIDQEIAWIKRWSDDSPFSSDEMQSVDDEQTTETVSIALLDYRQPDMAASSKNLGDYVQTLACVSHLMKFDNLQLSGDKDIAEFLTGLADEIPERSQLNSSSPVNVDLWVAQRDATSQASRRDQSWMFAFGWYMHSQFGTKFDFPFNNNITPIFVSFHCNRNDLLDKDALEYLRKCGPIGCRDWSTVYLLRGAGVEAFFSGCLTTTINNLPGLERQETRNGKAPSGLFAVDSISHYEGHEPQQYRSVSHHLPHIVGDSFASNVIRAYQQLQEYVESAGHVITSRLHCHLPLRALGVPTEFEPRSDVDIRFPGLIGISSEAFERMQDRLNVNMAGTIEAILNGSTVEEVRNLWRSLWLPELRDAERRFEAPVDLPAANFDPDVAAQGVRSEATLSEPKESGLLDETIELAFALDSNLIEQLCVVSSAVDSRTQAPVRVWILHRGIDAEVRDVIVELFPRLNFNWLPCDLLDYGSISGMIAHTTISTMDRLLLAELLPDLDRIIYLDLDLLPLKGLDALWKTDLQGLALAARTTPRRGETGGYRDNVLPAFKRAANPADAEEIWRWACRERPHPFPALNAGVLVLDLDYLRKDDFARNYLGLVGSYGVNDQELLNLYVGSQRVHLAPEWNHLPMLESCEDPGIVHWAGAMKPWGPYRVPLQLEWDRQVAELRKRAVERGVSLPFEL